LQLEQCSFLYALVTLKMHLKLNVVCLLCDVHTLALSEESYHNAFIPAMIPDNCKLQQLCMLIEIATQERLAVKKLVPMRV